MNQHLRRLLLFLSVILLLSAFLFPASFAEEQAEDVVEDVIPLLKRKVILVQVFQKMVNQEKRGY